MSLSSGPVACHHFAVTDKGEVYAWGRNEKGQLGLGDTKDRKVPTLIKDLTGHKISKVAVGRNHSLFLTDEGKVLGCGDNRFGQVHGKNIMIKTPELISWDGPSASRISCGADFRCVMILTG